MKLDREPYSPLGENPVGIVNADDEIFVVLFQENHAKVLVEMLNEQYAKAVAYPPNYSIARDECDLYNTIAANYRYFDKLMDGKKSHRIHPRRRRPYETNLQAEVVTPSGRA